MRKPTLALESFRFLAAVALSLVIVTGCTHGRGFYGFHWSYCKFFGYPKLLDCIAPPPADLFVLPPVREPDENPASKEKAELGKLLFFDMRLSSMGKVSCATCHAPEKGFADPRTRQNRLSKGITNQEGRPQEGRRNAPTVLNSAFYHVFFWDGRAASLEEQAEGPLKNDKEMGPEEDLDKRVKRLNDDPDTRARFERAFGSPEVTVPRIVQALATFERSLLSRDTAFHRWVREEAPMPSWSAERGWEVFRGRGQCAVCHARPLFTDVYDDTSADKSTEKGFHNIGIRRHPADAPDVGRLEYLSSLVGPEKPVNPQEAEKNKCAFKTPSLFNVRETAPYMHNGTLETLEDVVSFYARFNPWGEYARSDSPADDPECGKPDPQLAQIRGMLTPDEQMDLVEFLRSLSPEAGAYCEFLKSLDLPACQREAAQTTQTR